VVGLAWTDGEEMIAVPEPDNDASFGGKRARQRAQARERLLTAAKDVFAEKGFLEVRVADIAGRAGVSHGLFYHYFESKQDIFRELATSADERLTDTMDGVLDQSSAMAPQTRLKDAFRLHFEKFRDEARMMELIAEVSRHDDQVKAARDALHRKENERLVEMIRQLQQQGLADRRLNPDVVAVAIGSMTWGFAESWLVRGELDYDFDEGVEQVTMLLTNALCLTD
jgi:AcrR family transcriptional regulator